MNKILVVLLAVCLINVHAFVKRDTATTEPPVSVDKIKEEASKIGEFIKTEFEKAFNPETIKTRFNQAVDTVNEAINSMKNNQEPPKK